MAVTGSYSDESQTTITVNGVAAVLNAGNFTATVPLIEGANALAVHAVDSAGNASDATRTITCDTTPPAVAIQQPTANSATNSSQVTVSGTFSDATTTTVKVNDIVAALSGNTFSASVPLSEGGNLLNVTAIDGAGNQGTASRNLTRDTTAPTIAISQPGEGTFTANTQVTVTGNFSDATATTITVNGIAAIVSGNSFSALVTLSDGSNTIQAVAVDAAQNTSQATRGITLDTAAPTIVIQRPAGDAVTSGAQFDVTGVIVDATATVVTINGIQVVLTGTSLAASVQLNDGANVVHVQATDAAGNHGEVTRTITRDNVAPSLTINAPANNFITINNLVRVSGSASDATAITVTANDSVLSLEANGGFSDMMGLPVGTTVVQFVATDAAGNRSQPLTRSVTIDNLPPAISELEPVDESIVDGATTTVHGRVTDTTASVVKVNNIIAVVDPSGLFTAENVPLLEGDNRFTISAVDAAGNSNAAALVLIGKDRTPPPAPVLVPVSSPTRLAFQTVEGRAEPGSHVTITGGVVPVGVDAVAGTGLFVANLDLVAGINTFAAIAADAAGNTSPAVNFSVSSDPDMALPPAGQPAQINMSTGGAQRGLGGMELPRPLIAIVTDRNGDPLPGISVSFTRTQGDGHFLSGNETVQVVSDADGRAPTRYVAGSATGIHIIRANFVNNASTPAIFTAETLETAGGITTVSGLVTDQNLRALPNVLARIGGQQARTGNDGRFKITNVAVGPHQVLELIGRDQITLPGRWPNISYDFDVLPGIDNELGRPLFLPRVNDGVVMPLDSNNVITQDTVFDLPVVGGEEPIRITAKAGTHITFPPDVTDKRLSVTRIATNRTPMVLEDGRATNLYISVQPSGAIFETPLEVSFPNVDQLPAGAEVLLMSFDHEAGRYVRVGTGHVRADGRAVTSDAGSGIRVGAWHALPPPPPQPEVTVLGHIQIKGNPAFAKKGILSAEAWVEGERAVLLSSRNAEDRLDFRATYSIPPGSAPKLAAMEAVTVTVDYGGVMEAEGRNPDGSIATNEPPSPNYPLLAFASSPYTVTKSLSDSPLALGVPSYPQIPPGGPSDLGVRYGGSEDSTSDELLVRVHLQPGMEALTPRKVVWTVSGPGSDAYEILRTRRLPRSRGI